MVHDKRVLLDHTASRRAFIAIDRGPLDVRIHGDVAIMTGTMTSRMRSPDGELTLTGFVTQVLRREAGNWRFIYFQLTLISN